MISYHPLCTFFLCNEWKKKKKKFHFESTWFERFRSAWELWMTLCNKYQSKSDILWWHVLVIQRCPMKYWKQRYVGVDFDHCRPCLSSAALRLCQTRSKHTATCVSGQSFPQNSHFPCPAYLQQRRVLKIQPTACTSLIYLLVCHMPRVTLRRNHWCAHADTGTRAPICDTCRWTNRDKRFPHRQIKPCIVRQAVLTKLVCQSKIHQGGFKRHSDAKITDISL